MALSSLFMFLLLAATDAPAGKDPETTVAGVTVTKPVCRQVRETGARAARRVCSSGPGSAPPSLEVRSLSPTIYKGQQGNINQAPRE